MWRLIFVLVALHSVSPAPWNTLTLQLDIVKELSGVVVETLTEGIDLLQRVIDDAELLLPPNTQLRVLAEFEDFIDIATDLIKSIDDSDEFGDFEEMVNELGDLLDLDEYEETDKLVNRLLLQHGVDEFEQRVEEKMLRALHRIEQLVEAYVNRLSGPKLERHADVVNWFVDFRDEQDLEKKFMMVMDLAFWD